MRTVEGKTIEGDPTWHLSDRQVHEVFIGKSSLLPELPLVGRMQLLDALPNALVPHKHDDVYEVTLVLDGCLDFTVGEKHHPTRGGMVFITRPGEMHGSIDSTLQPAEWYWAHLRLPERGTAMPGLSAEDTEALIEAFAGLSQHLIYGSEALQECFAQLLAEHRLRRPLAQLAARACCHRLLVQILRDYERSQSLQSSQEPSRPIRLAIHWLSLHLGNAVSVTELAEASGLSEGHFRQRFHQEMGISPSDFIARRRVQKAKALLRSSELSITDIAFQLGFQSSPYFAAVFKKLTGQTPSQFRESNVDASAP
jgi:AraC-like DNA-binding protein